MAKTWTNYKLTETQLKLLANGARKLKQGDRGYVGGPGQGHGSSAGRAALRRKNLIDDYHRINTHGLDALESARGEGWSWRTSRNTGTSRFRPARCG